MKATLELPAVHDAMDSMFGGYYRLQFRAMGTHNEVLYAANSASMAAAFRGDLLAWVDAFEKKVSRFRDDSLVSEINRSAGKQWVTIDQETEELIALTDWFHWKTKGIFDPTLLPLIRLWDYHAPEPKLPASVDVARARALAGWQKVQREPGRIRLPTAGMAIDLGGIGKEYAVDKAIVLAKRHGVTSAMVNFGRDIRVIGHPPEDGPWRIGLENPGDADACWSGVALGNQAVCGSGMYARGFDIGGRRYGHILDPRTGWPAESGCTAAWVIAPSCTEAGILSSAAVVLGVEQGMELIESTWHAAGCLWTARGVFYSRRLHDYLIDSE